MARYCDAVYDLSIITSPRRSFYASRGAVARRLVPFGHRNVAPLYMAHRSPPGSLRGWGTAKKRSLFCGSRLRGITKPGVTLWPIAFGRLARIRSGEEELREPLQSQSTINRGRIPTLHFDIVIRYAPIDHLSNVKTHTHTPTRGHVVELTAWRSVTFDECQSKREK
jgi:hypothetical protein